MCRINPNTVRISNISENRDYMIVNGDKLDDIYGTMKTMKLDLIKFCY